jgi:hypothetical protein
MGVTLGDEKLFRGQSYNLFQPPFTHTLSPIVYEFREGVRTGPCLASTTTIHGLETVLITGVVLTGLHR